MGMPALAVSLQSSHSLCKLWTGSNFACTSFVQFRVILDELAKGASTMSTTVTRPTPTVADTQRQSEQQASQSPVLTAKTPPEFYTEVTKRVDVRAILEDLAAG